MLDKDSFIPGWVQSPDEILRINTLWDTKKKWHVRPVQKKGKK